MKWSEGPPPGQGRWWIYRVGRVEAVEVSPALVTPGARLLLKTMGGMAYDFEANRPMISHHAPLATPDAPISGGADNRGEGEGWCLVTF